MPTTEERLAALEKQMAAWIDQQPTTYYTHQYSGEEIDAAVGRAVTGGALDTSVTNVGDQLGTFVRPNLLDNWYFGRPVNQRGEKNYSNDWVYTIDRWQTSENSTLTVNNGGVSLTGSYFFEPLEEIVDALKGKTVTISLLFATGELEFATGVVPTTWGSWSSIAKNGHVGLQGIGEDSTRLWLLITDDAKNILAAKLELGPTQTLAHREGDKWVINEVPEYGGQLRRCQRYFWRFSPAEYVAGATAFGIDANTARAMIYLPEQMRTSPALNLNASEEFFLTGASGDIFNTIVSTVWTAPNSVCVDFKKSGAFEVNAPYFVRGGDFAYIDISADL